MPKDEDSGATADIIAEMFCRALLLNTDGKANSHHTDCGVWLFEDNYNLDIDILPPKKN